MHSVCLLGGFSWALMVAKACMVFPGLSAADTLEQFYGLFAHWPFPEPVMLIPLDQIPKSNANAGIKAWTVQAARHHKLPVLSPTHPPENTARNVTASTRRVLQHEFKAAAESLYLIRCAAQPSDLATTLLAPTNLLAVYAKFLVIEMHADTADNLAVWAGYVFSRTPSLIELLEGLGLHVHPCGRKLPS